MKLERTRSWIGENKIRLFAVILAALLLLALLGGLLLVNIGIGRLSYEADDTEPVTIDPAYAAGNGIYFPEIEMIRKPGIINVLFLGTDFAIGEEGSRGRICRIFSTVFTVPILPGAAPKEAAASASRS